MQRIGVRELRQHATRYMTQVARGERIEVTGRGRPIATLVPRGIDAWSDLVASGRAAPPVEETGIPHARRRR
jgi:prevent-host-death family protein